MTQTADDSGRLAVAQAEEQVQSEVRDMPVSAAAWLAEIRAAQKREKAWRDEAQKTLERYENRKNDAGTFNILWSNTETLRNAVYSQSPRPDVRQRWPKKDALALAVAQVLDRALEYLIDVGNFDDAARKAVLDLLLPGRAVMRVRYEPEMVRQAGPDGVFYDAVAAENVVFEPVGYKDFVHHDAPDWRRVEWCAFRHHVTRADAQELFPEYAEELSYTARTDGIEDNEQRQASTGSESEEHTDMDARAEVWEVWDRRGKSVVWVSRGIASALSRSEPPLVLADFFPVARPMYAIAQPGSLVPSTLFSQYEVQADELDVLTARIEATSRIIKWRGAYDKSLGAEVEDVLTSAQDGDLVPVDASSILLERGGFAGALWLFPVKDAVEVLKTLYESREATKQTIYEITGISDILRGVTDAGETATAQQIKAAWGSSRVDGYKREIQRFLADTLRIAAEVVAETYQTESLAAITGLDFPLLEKKREAQMRIEQGQHLLQQAAQQGQEEQARELHQKLEPLRQVAQAPAWEEIQQILQNDLLRSYKISIETDSTMAPNQQQDLKDLGETMQAVGAYGQQFLPGVEAGIIPPEMFARILYSVIRKTPLSNDLGSYFDEYLDRIGASNPVQKQLDELKEELKAAKDARAVKEQEIKLKAAELQQRGLLEGKKIELEAAELAQRPQLEAARAQGAFVRRVMAAQSRGARPAEGI